MSHDIQKAIRADSPDRLVPAPDFADLLHPAGAFARPSDVAEDPDLTINEKRAILASWASDACAAESSPALRQAGDGRTASWDEIMDALHQLDLQAARSALARSSPDAFWWPRNGLQHGSSDKLIREAKPAAGKTG